MKTSIVNFRPNKHTVILQCERTAMGDKAQPYRLALYHDTKLDTYGVHYWWGGCVVLDRPIYDFARKISVDMAEAVVNDAIGYHMSQDLHEDALYSAGNLGMCGSCQFTNEHTARKLYLELFRHCVIPAWELYIAQPLKNTSARFGRDDMSLQQIAHVASFITRSRVKALAPCGNFL